MKDVRPSPGAAGWLPGAVILGLAVAVGVGGGWLAGLRWWPLHLALVVSTLLGLGAVERFLARRAAPQVPRLRRRLRVIQGGKAYDLADEDATKDQRYLM